MILYKYTALSALLYYISSRADGDRVGAQQTSGGRAVARGTTAAGQQTCVGAVGGYTQTRDVHRTVNWYGRKFYGVITDTGRKFTVSKSVRVGLVRYWYGCFTGRKRVYGPRVSAVTRAVLIMRSYDFYDLNIGADASAAWLRRLRQDIGPLKGARATARGL